MLPGYILSMEGLSLGNGRDGHSHAGDSNQEVTATAYLLQ
jgi:hypothetical protein